MSYISVIQYFSFLYRVYSIYRVLEECKLAMLKHRGVLQNLGNLWLALIIICLFFIFTYLLLPLLSSPWMQMWVSPKDLNQMAGKQMPHHCSRVSCLLGFNQLIFPSIIKRLVHFFVFHHLDLYRSFPMPCHYSHISKVDCM